MSRAEEPYDVAVVGYGPVGATAAGLLARDGMSTIVIERADDIFDQPRAIGFDHEVMRIFQAAGAAHHILPHTIPSRPMEFRGARGQPIRRIRQMDPPYPLGWNPNYSFDQPGLERALRRCVESYDSVDVRLSCEMEALTEQDDHIEIAVRDFATGDRATLRAQYVLACDGARSATRKQLGIESVDLGFDEPWIVIDLYARDAEKLPDANLQLCNPERPTTYIVGPGTHRRWEMMLLPGESPQDIDNEARILELLAPWGRPGDFTFRRSAVYRFHAVIASTWRRGRILLAGDAAHQTPPFMGQGMCQGIRDAANAAWKLKRVVRGASSADLLDTYQVERAPHVETTTKRAIELGREVCLRDRAATETRDEALAAELASGRMVTVRQSFIPPLVTGLLDLDDAGRPRGPAGAMLPQPRVATDDGRECLLDDAVAPGFLLVHDPSRGPLSVSDRRLADWSSLGGGTVSLHTGGELPALSAAGRHAVDLDGLLTRYLADLGCLALVVRPDKYVYGAAVSAEDLDRQIATLAAGLA